VFFIPFEEVPPLVKSLDHYTRIQIDSLKDLAPDFKIIALNITILDGSPANRVVGSFTTIGNQSSRYNMNEVVTYEQVLTLKDGTFYRMVYFDPPKRYAEYFDVNKMIGSFRFINATGLEDLIPG
jgi:hypothetical protein